ncbi:MAG: hypothetical protein ACJ74H_12165 [Thermoanaerobaculia bacterium]
MRKILIVFLLLTGCASYRPNAQATKLDVIEKAPAYSLGIVEFDDQGWFFDRADVERVLSMVEDEAKGNGATVVVFAHGWHHNAAANDENLTEFKAALASIDELLHRPLYKSVRDIVLKGAKNRVVGVYVGWRGASLPGKLDYGTFWDRRDAAIRVGHGDVVELFTRLAKIQADHNDAEKKEFTTLVAMGQSFGGQVVFAAVSDVLKARIAEHLPAKAFPILHGFGDLVVLVNPAHEASIYNSIDLLTRDAAFDKKQQPILLTISSEGDWPNRVFFPIGRHLGSRHEPDGTDAQYEQKTHSHGHYVPHLTHCLFETGKTKCKGLTVPDVPAGPQISDDTVVTEPMLNVWKLVPIDLAIGRPYGETTFSALPPEVDPNNPFLVTKATRDVVGGHDDMFNEKLLGFVARFVGLAQLKRLVTY